MRTLRLPFLLLVSLTILTGVLAQHPARPSAPPPRIQFEHLTTADGLPENSVTCMLQDHLGFMWLGTQNGLVRYDGTHMTTFQYDPKKPYSLKGGQIGALIEDRNGDIWIGSESLFRWERATGRFIEYPRKSPEKTEPALDGILFIYEDKQGAIWTITPRNEYRNLVLDRLTPRTGIWTYFRHNPKDPHSLASNSMYGRRIQDVLDYSFEESEDGKIWFVTHGLTENTLHWIDPKTNRVTRVQSTGNAALQPAFKRIGVLTTAREYIYIASYEQGLFRLNTRSGRFDYFRHDNRNPASMRCDTVLKVHPHRDGSVWVATSQGLDQLNPKTGLFRHIVSRPDDPTTPSPGPLQFLHELPNGNMWFRSQEGLNQYNRQRDQFIRYPFDPTQGEGTLHGRKYSSFLVDSRGLAWVGTLFNGLNKQSQTAHFPLLTHDPNQVNSLQSSSVRVVYEAPSEPGIIWFGTDKGLDRLDKKTGRFTHYRPDSLNRFALQKGGIIALAEDKKGNFWVGTMKDGLYQMDRNAGQFTHFPHNPADPTSLMVNWVTTLLADSDGTLWVGTRVGLDHFDPDRNTFTHYYEADSTYTPALFSRINQLSTPQRRLASILHPGFNVNQTVPFTVNQPDNFLVVAGGDIDPNLTISYGWIEDATGKRIWEFSADHSVSDGAYRNVRVQANVIRLQAGQYQLHYKSSDFYSYGHWAVAPPYHPELWGIQLLSLPAAESHELDALIRQRYFRLGVSGKGISTLRQDEAGRIWIGSNNGGINRIDFRTGQFKAYVDLLTGPRVITSLLEDRQAGGFWVGDYIFGLLFLDRQGKVTRRYAAGSGLPGSSVRGIQRDQAGYLWVTTNNGLVRLNRNAETEQFWVYNETNGVQNFERSSSENVFQASDGELYVSGEKGVHTFYPNQIQIDPVAPPVVLTDLFINGHPATYGKGCQLPTHISIAKDITLPYDQNDLTFQFAALSYNRGNQSRYAYQLTPIDKDWVQNGTVRQIRYSDLRPGTYTLHVKAANTDGIWNEKGTSIQLTIRPPWWQTWWAYLLYALLFLALLRAYIVYRSRTLVWENQVLEAKVAQRTNEVEQQKEEIEAQRDHLEETLTELKTTQDQLIQKEKLASLGELTAGIAHEIQNPLNFVNNFSEISSELVSELREEEAKPDRDEELIADLFNDLSNNLQKINHHGGRASGIVKGMLEHSRTETGEKRPTDLNTLADEYLKIAYHGMRAKDKTGFNCELVADFDADLGLAEVAPQEIGRVLLNLYNNAFYAVQARQQADVSDYQPIVSVRTRLTPRPLSGGRGVNQVEIRVRDNGTGIPESVKAKVFQPFFTTKPTGEGTGLGLSLSYDIITKGHGGTLTVASMEGEGTEFVIILPV